MKLQAKQRLQAHGGQTLNTEQLKAICNEIFKAQTDAIKKGLKEVDGKPFKYADAVSHRKFNTKSGGDKNALDQFKKWCPGQELPKGGYAGGHFDLTWKDLR